MFCFCNVDKKNLTFLLFSLVGATRAAVDAGYVPNELQVTFINVLPNLEEYFVFNVMT